MAGTMKLLIGAAVLFSVAAVMYCHSEDTCFDDNFGILELTGELESTCGTTNSTRILEMVSLN